MDLSSAADGQEGERPLRDYGNRDCFDQRQIESHHTEEWGSTPMYVGLHFPTDSKKRHRRRHKHRHPPPAKNTGDEPIKPSTPPSERVQFLLGQDDDDEAHKAHDMFCEMDELRSVGDDGDLEWKETARWVKFEEDVEEGGERWSKPHVATLSLHSLFELRKGILSGTVMLDMNANNIFQVADLVLDNMVASKHLEESKKELVRDALLSRHRHQHNKSNHNEKKGLPLIRSLAEIGKKHSEKKLEHKELSHSQSYSAEHLAIPGTSGPPRITVGNGSDEDDGLSKSRTEPGQLKGSGSSKDLLRTESGGTLSETASSHKVNQHFMKKLPPGAEASNILVGEVDFLSNPIIAFVRLTKAEMLGDLTEVPVPTRFIFLLLGPQGHKERYHEIGRSIATLMSDEIFHDVAYKAKNREDLLAGIDEFLDQVTVLPPGEWDPSIRIEPPPSVPSQSSRKTGGQLPRGGSGTLGGVPNGSALKEEEEEEHGDATLVRTGRMFGGLINDVKRKAPFYLSDIKDALHIQCLASFVFLYFACLTPIITFGGLLGHATENHIAAMESILCGAISGISYHLFAGQPLTIIGSTGPVLVFETIVYTFCKDTGLNYLPLRFWIGMWVCICLLIMVAFDLSALVRYITRFTEESFAVLIGLIFIYEAFKKLIHISEDDAPVDLTPDIDENYTCICYPPMPTPAPNTTANTVTDGMQAVTTTISSLMSTVTGNVTNITIPDKYFGLNYEDCKKAKGVPIGPGCGHHEPVPDVFFLSCLLFIGTFAISFSLKEFKTSRYFPTKVRSLISDFSVLLAIVLMVGVDVGLGLATPKLKVPSKFKPTRDDRGWVVNPLDNPLWTIPAGILPALLATILIFMDQQITAVIVNRKEHKLLKGGGYHLDLFIIAILIGICSILGLPWFVAATVLSINHVRSLTRESETAAPGEKPQFLGVREQRVTGVVVFIFVGLSVVLTGVLKFIPMPVLYGVFLFMGISSLKGVQFIQRITIIFMPPKYQPDYMFLRHVPLKRCHLFTAIQILCLAILWTIKQIKQISIVFPLMVLAMCFVRKAMDFLFTRHELKWLDDIMPESHKREKEDAKKKLEEDREREEQIIEMRGGGTLQVPLRDGKRLTIPVDQLTYNPTKKEVNISEEMSRTAIWKQLVANEDPETIGGYRPRKRKPRRSSVVEQGRDDIEMQKVKLDSNPQVRFKISDDDDECKPMITHAPEIVVDPPSTQSR